MSARDNRRLTYTSEGPDDAPILVFVHGWPDDPVMWRNQVDALKTQYRCVLPTLPNFGATTIESGGCDFPEIVERLHSCISDLGDDPIVLVTHDWGAYVGYLYEKAYPERVRTMIALDIGGHFEPSNLREGAMFIGYQWTLVVLWLIGGLVPPLGTWLTRHFARMLKVPERQVSGLRSCCNYPYFYFWRATVLPWARSRLLGRYRPQCSVLFIYGGNKPLMFHSARWLDIVEQSGGQSACIDEGSHWFMESHPAQTNRLLSDWLSEKAYKGDPA